MVTSASSFGRVVTDTRLFVDRATGEVDRGRTTSANHLVTHTNPDPTQTAIIARWKAISAPIANRVVGSISADLTRSANRDTESTMANVIADAQLAATRVNGAQLALMNPGGVRGDLTVAQISGGERAGQVTYGEAFVVQPFGNLLVTMDMTGDQIERLLEQQYDADRPGTRPQLIFGVSAGLTFAYDATQPEGSRVSRVLLGGAPLGPATTYKVTTNSFLADGGDAFTVFREGTNRVGGGEDLRALLDYFATSSPVAPPSDRIAGI
jgi:2',3'-cyclic-nucleotide 2'-phosphodiesterase (5'-nucleotidase family)